MNTGEAEEGKTQGDREKPKGWHHRGYLPHFDGSRTNQAVTFRLADSLPKHVLEGWLRELATETDEMRATVMLRRVNEYLDAGHGECLLKVPAAADIMRDALLHFDGERYRLHNWCVMPNHVHVLLSQMPGWGLPGIVHSWKSFTSKAINKVLARTGQLWMPDYFDRFIRDHAHFGKATAYVDMNPVIAGLCKAPEEWPWCAKGASHAATSGPEARAPSGGRDGRAP